MGQRGREHLHQSAQRVDNWAIIIYYAPRTLTPGPSPATGEGSWFPLPGERVRVRGCIVTFYRHLSRTTHPHRPLSRDGRGELVPSPWGEG
jgi:hypothetical protein